MRYMVVAWNDGEKILAVLLSDDEGEVALFPDEYSATEAAIGSGHDCYKIVDTSTCYAA
jgi:hypothetical protein